MTKWQKKLTKAERQHLKDTGVTNLTQVRENVLFQAHNQFPCSECVSIGRKLGIEVDLAAFHERFAE